MMGIDVLALQQRQKKKFNGDRYETGPQVNFFPQRLFPVFDPKFSVPSEPSWPA